MFVIIAGNVIDGLDLIGPFPTAEEANEFGDQYVEREFVVSQLMSPCEVIGMVEVES